MESPFALISVKGVFCAVRVPVHRRELRGWYRVYRAVAIDNTADFGYKRGLQATET